MKPYTTVIEDIFGQQWVVEEKWVEVTLAQLDKFNSQPNEVIGEGIIEMYDEVDFFKKLS